VSDGGDEPRLLHVRSELAYTHDVHHALRDEPEAVSDQEQRVLTQRARLDWVARRRRAWAETIEIVAPALDAFCDTINGDRSLQHAVRAVRRSVDAVSRRLA
jgi:hypothetical protein